MLALPTGFADPLAAVRAARTSLRPPPRMRLSTWIESHVVLPDGVSATPGPAQLWPYQRDIADAIGDPSVERVTVVKPVRVGFTFLLTSAVASFVANDPAPIIVLQPTADDCRDFVVSDLEPTFAATAVVAGVLEDDSEGGERNTMTSRRFPGGSLKIVAAKAPRNLRRHTTRVLLIDECDAMQPGPEGSPLLLAERRTLSFPDRKIVLGSTPLAEDTSNVLRAYAASDRRVFEIPCPACAAFVELQWAMIEWERDAPATAAFRCPTCRALSPETLKPAMVHGGRWRATVPEVRGHAGFRLNALVSLLANAAWGKLAAEFLRARNDTTELQTFVNTILGQGWREEGDEIDDAAPAERAEGFGLDAIPEPVLLLTCGVDVQEDRLEATVLGWSPVDAYVLGHVVLWGAPQALQDSVWVELEDFLLRPFRHPLGGALRIDATIVDSGDATDTVYAFTFPRLRRRVWAGKGVPGSRQAYQLSASKVRRHGDRGVSGRLVLVGVDTLKATLFDKIARNAGVRFSATLEPHWYEQLASERKVVRYHRGQPVRSFERIKGKRAEALDCVIYAMAARAGLTGIDWTAREAAMRVHQPTPALPGPLAGGRAGAIRSHWMERFR